MRKEYVALEDKFYETYNRVNTDHQWDVNCRLAMGTGSRIPARVCMPVFVDEITHEFFRTSVIGTAAGDPWAQIQAKREGFRKNLMDHVSKNPQLLELLMKRNAAAQRYAVVRKAEVPGPTDRVGLSDRGLEASLAGP